MDELIKLSNLLKEKIQIEQKISVIIGRPALIGHAGEYIASLVFDIQLEESAAQKSIDGYFRSGPLAGQSVNIKWYAKQEGFLDITPDAMPDVYLVLAGPITQPASSRGSTRPWIIERVYLFEAKTLVERLLQEKIKIGVATSVAKAYWEAAEIYPLARNPALPLSEQAKSLLALFGR